MKYFHERVWRTFLLLFYMHLSCKRLEIGKPAWNSEFWSVIFWSSYCITVRLLADARQRITDLSNCFTFITTTLVSLSFSPLIVFQSSSDLKSSLKFSLTTKLLKNLLPCSSFRYQGPCGGMYIQICRIAFLLKIISRSCPIQFQIIYFLSFQQ